MASIPGEVGMVKVAVTTPETLVLLASAKEIPEKEAPLISWVRNELLAFGINAHPWLEL
jgi:hypothetical protein